VDGNGISKIEDESLARRLLGLINDMNDTIAWRSALGCVVFAALPKNFVSVVATMVVVLAGLYLVEDKLPENP